MVKQRLISGAWGYLFLITLLVIGNGQMEAAEVNNNEQRSDQLEVATFGGGFFWCVEAVFEQLEGVVDVISGYAGGTVPNPTYEQVCTGLTGHAEVCQIRYDPRKITYEELLEVFFKTHDPTTLNRQGADVGTQYRSIILYHNEKQKEAAERMIEKLNKAGVFDSPIVTQVEKLTKFYPAEDYHQDYFRKNPENRYCALVVRPKVEKAAKVFKDKLKKEKQTLTPE